MLIGVTKLMEIPKIPPVISRRRAVAWLKRIDDGNYCVGNPFELTPLVTVVFTTIDKDWELIAGSGHIPLRQNQLPNKMVEGTSEIVLSPIRKPRLLGMGGTLSKL